MLKRRSLSLRASLKALEIFSGLPIRYVDVSIQESLQIAGDLGLYAYDAYLLVCARTFNAPLITLDRGLRKAAAGLGVKVVSF